MLKITIFSLFGSINVANLIWIEVLRRLSILQWNKTNWNLNGTMDFFLFCSLDRIWEKWCTLWLMCIESYHRIKVVVVGSPETNIFYHPFRYFVVEFFTLFHIVWKNKKKYKQRKSVALLGNYLGEKLLLTLLLKGFRKVKKKDAEDMRNLLD